MDIKFENIDKVSGKLTATVVPADYEEGIEKSLKELRRKSNMKGFRPGQVPMGMIRKLYGGEVKAEEVYKALNDGVSKYISDNKINIMGNVLPSDEKKEYDFKNDDTFEFTMDVALAPTVDIVLDKSDKLPYYDITLSDKFVDDRISELRNAHGSFEQVEQYSKGDYLKGDLAEVSAPEGVEPLKIEGVLISPEYVKDEAQQKLFDGARKDDVLTIKPATLYQDETQAAAMLKIKKEELKDHEGDFTYTITEINHHKPADLNQEFFDAVCGKDAVKDEEGLRAKIREDYVKQESGNADFKFYYDLREYAIAKQGKLEFSEPLMKRLMKENNPDKDDKFVDENYEKSIDQLGWQLIRDHLAVAADIKIDDKDILEMAHSRTRRQFAAYGMTQLPDELIDKYVQRTLGDNKQVEELFYDALVEKLTAAYKERVTLEHKKILLEDFEKLLKEDMEKQQNA